jgi:hypothetical protein
MAFSVIWPYLNVRNMLVRFFRHQAVQVWQPDRVMFELEYDKGSHIFPVRSTLQLKFIGVSCVHILDASSKSSEHACALPVSDGFKLHRFKLHRSLSTAS